jgi:hypothetical protein
MNLRAEITPEEYNELVDHYGSMPNMDIYPKQFEHKVITYRYHKQTQKVPDEICSD